MPLNPSFSISQPEGDSSVIIVTDTSSGSDTDITYRKVYLLKSDGTFLVPTGTTTDFIIWDYANASIEIDCLEKDMALQITIEWLNVSNSVLYSAPGLYGLTSYNETFDYNLTSILASNPLLVNDNSFRNNKTNLRLYIDAGNQAIEVGSDIEAAQLCYDEATKLRTSSQYYFNESTGT